MTTNQTQQTIEQNPCLFYGTIVVKLPIFASPFDPVEDYIRNAVQLRKNADALTKRGFAITDALGVC